MINGLNLSSYKLKIVGDGLNLTGSTVKKGRGCNIKCDKKRMLKNNSWRIENIKIIFLINI